jgi:uracil-DNA glycosylase
MSNETMIDLLAAVRACTACEANLPAGPRPVLQAHAAARVLIAAQAPGRKVHATGVPFDDASGERLRDWLGLTRDTFYDARQVAILPMAFCYPGQGRSGDLPPRPECAARWRAPLLAQLTRVRLTLVIGQYAQRYHLPELAHQSISDIVEQGPHTLWPDVVPLPHPSPRNNIWLKRHPWFESRLLPALRPLVQRALNG